MLSAVSTAMHLSSILCPKMILFLIYEFEMLHPFVPMKPVLVVSVKNNFTTLDPEEFPKTLPKP